MILILAVALLAPATTILITSWPFLIPEIYNFLSSTELKASSAGAQSLHKIKMTLPKSMLDLNDEDIWKIEKLEEQSKF